MKLNISLLVGLKNNLDYTQNFYKTTRELYPTAEICFTSYGSTDGTHEWLLGLDDPNLKFYISDENKTFSDTFNKCAEIATNDYIVLLHNDIVLASGFLERLLSRLSPNNVVSYTTVEPPIFAGHERPGKMIKDFGSDLETFKKEEFQTFAAEVSEEVEFFIEKGAAFFMSLSKKVYTDMGGMDNLFTPMFSEDDDLIARLILQGLNLFTCLGAICYHFVSKTSRFSDEYRERTQQIEKESNRNFLRKWGGRTQGTIRRYKVGFSITNCNTQVIELLEPFVDHIYFNNGSEYKQYIILEQPKTQYDLTKRIIPNTDNFLDDYIIHFDAHQLNNENGKLLTMFQDSLKQIKEPGKYEYGPFVIEAINIRSHEGLLINNFKKR